MANTEEVLEEDAAADNDGFVEVVEGGNEYGILRHNSA
jgi:hypothetical protein